LLLEGVVGFWHDKDWKESMQHFLEKMPKQTISIFKILAFLELLDAIHWWE